MEDKRLDLLLTYTIFHIGVYLSLTTAFMGPVSWGTLIIRCFSGRSVASS